MTGSKFIVGILSSGVEAELAKTISLTAQILIDQNKVVVAEQQAYNAMALVNSQAVLTAENAMASVKEQEAITSWVEGGMQLTTPIATVGFRSYREGTEDDTDSQTISKARDNLEDGGANALLGPNGNPAEDADAIEPQKTKAQQLMTKDVEENLRRKSVVSKNPKVKDPNKLYNDEDMENLKLAKILKGEREPDGPNGEKGPLTSRGKLYDDLVDKFKDEDKGVQNRHSSYEETTTRRAQYVNSITQTATNMAKGGAQWSVAQESRTQAAADAIKQMTSYAETNQKSGADTAQQSFSNTAQLYDQETQMMRNLAQANAPV